MALNPEYDVDMSKLQEIKVAVASLPAEERSELADWLTELEDVREIRRAQLRREIEKGMGSIGRGEVAPLDMEEIKRKARARWGANSRN